MKKKIFLAGIVVAIIGAFVAYSMYNKPHRDIATEKTSFTVTSNQLFDDFENDEKLANEKYLDKVIEVTGTIIEINKDQTGNQVVTIGAENAMLGGVLGTMKNNTSLKIDQEVTLKCKCTGFLMDVVLTECTQIK